MTQRIVIIEDQFMESIFDFTITILEPIFFVSPPTYFYRQIFTPTIVKTKLIKYFFLSFQHRIMSFDTVDQLKTAFKKFDGYSYKGSEITCKYEYPEVLDPDWRGDASNDRPYYKNAVERISIDMEATQRDRNRSSRDRSRSPAKERKRSRSPPVTRRHSGERSRSRSRGLRSRSGSRY